MHQPGHIGAALLVYAPAGAAAIAVGAPELAVVGAVGAVLLATLPDVDHRLPLVSHRGITHTVHFVTAVGVLGAIAGVIVGLTDGPISAAGLGAFGFYVTAGTVASHIAVDALTPMGIEPFRDGRHYSFEVTRSDSPLANYTLLLLGGAAAGGALWLGSTLAALL